MSWLILSAIGALMSATSSKSDFKKKTGAFRREVEVWYMHQRLNSYGISSASLQPGNCCTVALFLLGWSVQLKISPETSSSNTPGDEIHVSGQGLGLLKLFVC